MFRENKFERFKQIIKKYCDSMDYHDLSLTEDELDQLTWYLSSGIVTPEARDEDIIEKLHFEIKRGLARRYSFELLLRGDPLSYQEFIRAQNKNALLSLETFTRLSDEARSLNEDVKTAIRVSCFLTLSEKAKEVLSENGYSLSNDSEEFLSQLAVILAKNTQLLPLTSHLTIGQVSLLEKIFWPNMHLRHLLYTEGGDNMTRTFVEGVTSGRFSKQDFVAWKWRWLSNLFGFQSGPAAKYFDAETFLLVSTVIAELEKLLAVPTYSYLDNYLLKRAEMAGLTNESLKLTQSDQQFLGHLVAYFHQINVLMPDVGKMIYAGYLAFRENSHNLSAVAERYEKYRYDAMAVTPTYVPAVINNAYIILKDKFGMSAPEAVKTSTQFMCQLLDALYTLPYDKRISCMNLAKDTNLQKILEKWISDQNAFTFRLNDNFELMAVENTQLISMLSSQINNNNQPFNPDNNVATSTHVRYQPLFQSFKMTSEQQPLVNDRDMRIAVVGEQRQIEEAMAKEANPKKAIAVFVVPTLLTPLYISPEDVEFNDAKQLFVLKIGGQIPDGLIPEAKLVDPQQLSTVLGRVLSVSQMLQAGIKVLILHQEEKRPKTDKKEGFVDETHLQSMINKYSSLITTVQISNIPKGVCAANYCYSSHDGVEHVVGIDASQVIATTDNWGVRYDKSKLNNLNQLFSENGLKSLAELSELDAIDVAKKSSLNLAFS